MLRQSSISNVYIARLARTLLYTNLKSLGFSVSPLALLVSALALVCCVRVISAILKLIFCGGLYGFFLAYLASPVFGWHLDTAHIVDFVYQMPDWVKYAGKTIVAAPFAFHSLNGVRHLAWDLTKGAPCSPSIWWRLPYLTCSVALSNRAVIRGGWAVVGGTVISTIALVLL